MEGVGEILHTICEVKSGLVWETNPGCRIQQLLMVNEELMYKALQNTQKSQCHREY